MSIRPTIPYVPPTDIHEKQDTKKIKVKLPDRTNFQMFTFGNGNNEEYLVHVIAVKHLIKHKRTDQYVKMAFQVLVEVRKELEPLLKAPEDKTEAKKEECRKKHLEYKKTLKAKCKLAVMEAQKAYELFHYFIFCEFRTQWDKIVHETHSKDP